MLLILDLDLTICDSFPRKQGAFERVLQRPLHEFEEAILRHNMQEAVFRLFKISDDQLRQIFKLFFYDDQLYERDVPLEGAVETVQGLAGRHKVYYVTGRPKRETAERFLERHRFPPGEVYAELVGPGESHKKTRMFRQILEKEGADFGVAVGDLPGDAIAARQAGLYAVGTIQAPEHNLLREDMEKVCDTVIDHITQLPQVLDRVEREGPGHRKA